MNNALRPVASVDDLLRLAPLDRLEALIGGANFAPFLREEPITFDMHDPTYGYGCVSKAALSTAPRRHGGAPGTRRSALMLHAVVSEKRTGRPQLCHFLPKGPEARWIAGCRPVVSARTGMPSLTISAAGTGHSATKLA